jgi:hypothetical protein
MTASNQRTQPTLAGQASYAIFRTIMQAKVTPSMLTPTAPNDGPKSCSGKSGLKVKASEPILFGRQCLSNAMAAVDGCGCISSALKVDLVERYHYRLEPGDTLFGQTLPWGILPYREFHPQVRQLCFQIACDLLGYRSTSATGTDSAQPI